MPEENNNTQVNPEAVDSNAFLSNLQDTLLKQSEAVSSSNTGIQDTIRGAMSGVRQAGQAQAQRIESEFGRNVTDVAEDSATSLAGIREARQGFATQVGVIRELSKRTDRSMADLDQRRQEALLSNDANVASQIAGLQLKQLEFQQDAEQQAFNNLLNLSNFGLSAAKFQEEQRQFGVGAEQAERELSLSERSQDFIERSAINDTALQYGLQVNEGDTLEDVINRAQPLASERQQLELSKLRAEIANQKAQTAKALQGDADRDPFDPMTAQILAQAYRRGETGFLSGLKTNEQFSSVYDAVTAMDIKDEQELRDIAANAKSPQEFTSMVESSPNIYEASIVSRVAASTDFSGGDTGTTDTNLPRIIGGAASGFSEGSQKMLEFITGVNRAN